MAEILEDSFVAEYLLRPVSGVCDATFAYHSQEEHCPEALEKVVRSIGHFHERISEVVDDTHPSLRDELTLFSGPTVNGFDTKKAEGIAILFQTLRRKLQNICAKKENERSYPLFRKESVSGHARAMIREDMHQVLEIGMKRKYWLDSEEYVVRFIREGKQNIYVLQDTDKDKIVAFTPVRFTDRYFQLEDIVTDPLYAERQVEETMLHAFHWKIPHEFKMQTHLLTRDIGEKEKRTLGIYTEQNFLAYGSKRNDEREITHYKLGKLTSEFRTRKKL